MHLCVVDTYAGVTYVVVAPLTIQNKVRICPSISKLPVKNLVMVVVVEPHLAGF